MSERITCMSKLRTLLSATKNKVQYISEGKSFIYIFGAGNTSKLYAKCFSNENIAPAGFLDNDPQKQGKSFLDNLCCNAEGGIVTLSSARA